MRIHASAIVNAFMLPHTLKAVIDAGLEVAGQVQSFLTVLLPLPPAPQGWALFALSASQL